MLDKFISDLESLLSQNKYEFIDVLPLFDKHFNHLNINEQLKYRLNAQTTIRRMKQDGLVDFKTGYFDITSNLPTRNSFIKSTYKFDKSKKSWIEIASWIIAIIVGAIAIYEFIIK